MDSFLDEPRTIPKPTPVIQEVGALSVPEVSLMFQNNKNDKTPTKFKYGKSLQSYNAWKLLSSPNNNADFDSFALPSKNNKENINVQDILLSKKQVRFESPRQEQQKSVTVPNTTSPILNKIKRPTYNYLLDKPIDFNNVTTKTNAITTNSPTSYIQPLENSSRNINKAFAYRPFEKLYVSNIPNKELDLSFLEPQKNPQQLTKIQSILNESNLNTYRTNFDRNLYGKQYSTGFLSNSQNIADQNNVKFTSTATNTTTNLSCVKPNENNNVQTEIVENDAKNNRNENQIENVNCSDPKTTTNDNSNTETTPTVTDLLTIIKLQNKQLQLLQDQVDKLIKININSEKTEPKKKQIQTDQCVGTSFNKIDEQMSVIPESDENQSKISVGLMTSFEVSFKPSVTKKVKPKNLVPLDCVTSNDVSFHESVRPGNRNRRMRRCERDFDDFKNVEKLLPRNNYISNKTANVTEYSLGSHEYFDVQEPPPESPDSSIHIDMNDYDTDSDDESSSLDPSWTFYKDILGQVNNILENTSPATCNREKCLPNRKNQPDNKLTDTTLQKIKHAALQRLQSESFLRKRASKDTKKNEQCLLKPNDISFAVKQILMKYMPDEGLANVVTRNEQEYVSNEQRSPNDVSVATFKYMQQCNLVTNSNPYYAKPPNHTKPKKYLNKYKDNPSSKDPKILDITTLKQQPKLL